MIDALKYTITVRKGLFDDEECFEARIAELPDVADYADSFAEAYNLAIDTIETTAEFFGYNRVYAIRGFWIAANLSLHFPRRRRTH